MKTKLKLFHWKAINRLQQKQHGIIIAESRTIAERALFSRHLQQVKLQRDWSFFSKPKPSEICDLISQLAILLKSAVSLKNSLQILKQNCMNIELNQWLQNILQSIESGLSFAQALQHHARYLTHQERQLIQVGEMTGQLPEVCQRIAKQQQQNVALQRKLQKILLYPLLVLGISLLLTGLLLLFVVPQFAEMYANNQAKLPMFTLILLQISDILQQYWFALLSVFIVSIWGIRWLLQRSLWLNKQKVRFISQVFLLKDIVKLERLIRFSNALQLMLQSGVPLTQALFSFLPTQQSWQRQQSVPQGDLVLIEEVKQILNWVQQGYSFSESVSSELFPYQAQQMLQVGEKSGQLGLMLQQIAVSYQQQLEHKVDLLSQLLEPVLMLIIGGLIGLIMLGMYMPIFDMGAMIQ
ncbi:type II secretion system F family protein [Conservatibacter flavescens]|uniref:Type II secretion system F family protein n=1 Tax=Conservatibacter flavescens TaxID=28161 RepID=A0A2M8S0M9_9PAST|nr:type II secretion system F family protein [Conservatibacter flavescens]PJG84664.1 type II secretion system F family protein [Conservatibacter flavescens]